MPGSNGNATEVLVVAGEASGDGHAAALVAELKSRRSDLHFFGMGGPKLAAQGVELVYGSHEISVMGFTEVLPKLLRIVSVMKGLEKTAAARRPAVAILVDIPDFNLRLAARLKKLGIKVAYYVSPMVWAWRSGRVKEIARVVDEMLCILPFEESFYRERGVPARYVGSPVLEGAPAPAEAAHFRNVLGLESGRPTLALLPGSRVSEIRKLLPTMLETATRLAQREPSLQVVIPVAPGMDRQEIESRIPASGPRPILIDGRAAEVVGASDAAIVASGTATLEAGLMRRPLVVVYRVSLISYWMGRFFLKIAHVALVNLLARRRLVPELLQGEMNPERISAEVERVWRPGPEREAVISGLDEVRSSLGDRRAASGAADAVLGLLTLPPPSPPR